jgi:hypothetical protein
MELHCQALKQGPQGVQGSIHVQGNLGVQKPGRQGLS